MKKITPFLWFETQAEEAAIFYTSIFKNSKIKETARYNAHAAKAAQRPEGSVMTVTFEIEDQEFTAFNGGPYFKFTEAVSFVVACKDQEEIDYFWNKLSEGGDPNAQQCGWLKDKFGVSWQITPTNIEELLTNPEAYKAMFNMKKLDIKTLQECINNG